MTDIEDILRRASEMLYSEGSTSQEIDRLQVEVGAACRVQKQRAQEAQSRANSPALTTAEAREAREEAEDAAHELRRLEAAGERLMDRHSEVWKAERAEERLENYETAQADSETLALRVAEEAPELILRLSALCWAIVGMDARSAAVNKALPPGKAPLRGVEGLAFGRRDDPGQQLPYDFGTFRLVQAVLPALTTPNAVAWPPARDYRRDYAGKPRLDSVQLVRALATK